MEHPDYTNERWKDVPGYEGLYQVSDMGRVRHLRTSGPRLRKPTKGGKGGLYENVNLYRKQKPRQFRVHRLVMLAFVGKPKPGREEIDHINGNKKDNRLVNLEYVSSRENSVRYNNKNGRKSGLLGVHVKANGKFKTSIKFEGKSYHLIHSPSKQLCAEIYRDAADAIRFNMFGGYLDWLSKYRTSEEKKIRENELLEEENGTVKRNRRCEEVHQKVQRV